MNDSKRHYSNPENFRSALEARLQKIAVTENIALQRIRRQVAFDRLLARIFLTKDSKEWVLKGGYAMELRIWDARTTRDMDLSLPFIEGSIQKDLIAERLQNAAKTELEDFFIFKIEEAKQELDGPPDGGFRYSVNALVGARLFTRFHIDIGIGDPIILPVEHFEGRDWLGFIGVPPAKIVAISKEQQFAEKLHAYTKPRRSPNSRVKDIIDLALLIRIGNLDKNKLNESIERTFYIYKTHPIPLHIPDPPLDWAESYAEISEEIHLNLSLQECIHEIRSVFSSLKNPNA